ncbi:MAG: arginine--tRNA ligase [Armatimonadota bacterium]
MSIREQLVEAVTGALERCAGEGLLRREEARVVELTTPGSAAQGDYCCDVTALLARGSGRSAGEAARCVAERLELPAGVAEVEASASGTLLFRLQPEALAGILEAISSQGGDYGRSGRGEGGRAVHLEFVSADPTAPLNASHGRGAVFGDALAGVLEWAGHRVTREFYLNDAGSQVERFGRDLLTRARDVSPSGSGATEEQHLQQLAAVVRERLGASEGQSPEERLQAAIDLGREAILESQRETLARLRVEFDIWRSERELRASGKVDEVLARLRAAGHVYDQDGAVWLRTTTFGDDEDRPLVRSNGQPTYFLGDLAYHLDKAERGSELLVDIWGPEHAAYVGRTAAGLQALGLPAETLRVLILQPVQVRSSSLGAEASPSSGNNVLLDEVIERVGVECARFLYLSRPAGAALSLPLGSDEAIPDADGLPRLRAVLARLRALGAPVGTGGSEVPAEPAARTLLRKLGELSDEVRAAAGELEPYRVARYLLETATAADAFLGSVESAGPSPGQRRVAEAAATVLANGLAVLDIRAHD